MTPILNDPGLLELRLNWPPSVNHIWRTQKRGARLSDEARAYFDATAITIAAQRAGRRFLGRVAVEVMLHPPIRRSRGDIDNRVKACLDACTKGGVWADDDQVDVLIVMRASTTPGGAAVVRIAEIEP